MVEVVTAFWEWEVGRMKGRKHEPLVFKSSREDVPKWCYSGVVDGSKAGILAILSVSFTFVGSSEGG